MKKMYSRNILGVMSVLAVSFSSCSDDFLTEKRNYDNTTTEIYDYYSGADGRLNDLYFWCNPNIQGAQGARLWQFPSMGLEDDLSQSTEEYAGFGCFVNPEAQMNTVTGTVQPPEYFQGTSPYSLNANAWGRIRNINDVIQGVANGALSQDEKDEIMGQAYFLRAWCYYYLVRYYGGVPIVTEVLDASSESAVPRSSTKACIDFICDDLQKAADLLHKRTVESKWPASEYGRVTTGTALALKGRVLLLWASPLFNRDNDPARWQAAYDFMTEALPVIESCGYGLGHESDPGTNGSGWARMFLDLTGNPEGVWVSLYNRKVPDLTPDYQRNNLWEQQIRPFNTLGNTGKTPPAMIIDLFPMKDGKKPRSYNSYSKLEASEYEYDQNNPYINRDPRFYRTFAFPGVYWRFKGDPNTSESCNPYTGENYVLWNYVWYNDPAEYDDPQGDSYGSDNLLEKVHGMYIRKFSDDLDVNPSPNYDFSTEGKSIGFRCCQTSTMEIRYAEVLLNLAEAACMTNHMDEAVRQLQRIRARAGYDASGNYGLSANLAGDQAACMSAILYERQIEFAYEGKRFEDMRRWLLFDGGANFAGAGLRPLTGWGGNTCTWLGVTPFNGQRRDNMEFRLQDEYNYTDGTSGRTWAVSSSDPSEREKDNPDPVIRSGMTREERDAYAIDLSKPLDDQVSRLKEFYDRFLQRKTKKGDGYDSNNAMLYVKFEPRYYILGLTQSAQTNNPTIEQTAGWEDYSRGGAPGTFDPLAE